VVKVSVDWQTWYASPAAKIALRISASCAAASAFVVHHDVSSYKGMERQGKQNAVEKGCQAVQSVCCVLAATSFTFPRVVSR
jgi:hypothetical protein